MRAGPRRIARVAAPLALALAFGGCAAAGGERSPAPGARGPAPMLRPVAQPGNVAATDIAFARTARETGQWSAFRAYAAPGALLHGADGPFLADPWLAAQPEPPVAVSWAPRAVWSSCDGTLAVTSGRAETPEGIVSTYVTVWQLQADGSYRWLYDTGTPDVPQPPPRPPRSAAPAGPDVILVPGLDAIDGRSADCPAPARPAAAGPGIPAPPPAPAPAPTGGASSADGTLAWRWEHLGEARWRVVVEWQRGGAWQQALSFAVPAEGPR